MNKPEKIPPKGHDSKNKFFNSVFADKEMIWMGQNTNHLHEHDFIADAMVKCVESKEYCKYPPPEGFPYLQKLILKDLDLEEMDILVTAGGTESLYVCISELIKKHNNVITCDPGYLIIDEFASRFSNEIRSIPIYNEECGYKLTPELVKQNIDENTKLIILIDPLNPLGTAYTEKEIKEFAQIAKENDIYLLHDITYKDFAREHFSVAKYAPDHSITIFSFSKIYGMAGLRIGAVISTPEIIDATRSELINDLGTNLISQAGAIAALESKPKWIESIVNTTRNNQKLIKTAVDSIDDIHIVAYPSDGNMFAIDIEKTGIDPVALANYLLKKKIFARQGVYTSKQFGDKYLRVSFSIPEEQVKIFCKELPLAIEKLKNK
ncbi:MAG: pyridoxal phosphate-dependent aminotransferase [Methanobrevibacter sp.]|jgi:aspartate/methionine/tyrosine aminotransferase|nr:pyridoxal phosphate-dependent aminotransferase [Candidatus Methanoflexus mossambicus]